MLHALFLLKSYVKIAILKQRKARIQLVVERDHVHLKDLAVTVKAKSKLFTAKP